MKKHMRTWLLVVAVVPAVLLLLFFATATYRSYDGLHFISRPPIANIIWGPKRHFIVWYGLNIVPDHQDSMPGNVIEFPISSRSKVSIRLFSMRWLFQDCLAFDSNHRATLRRIGVRPCTMLRPRRDNANGTSAPHEPTESRDAEKQPKKLGLRSG